MGKKKIGSSERLKLSRVGEKWQVSWKTLSNRIRDIFGGLLARKAHTSEPVVLWPEGKDRGCVALSYLAWPFQEGWDSPKARGHTNAFEVVTMAKAWSAEGFRVEICNFDDASYQPPRDCVVAIDLHRNLHEWASRGASDFIKVLHATGSHWKRHNQAELQRLDHLHERKGVKLEPRRQVQPSRAAEVADEITLLGNSFTMATYAFAGNPMTRIPISSAYEFTWPENRDFESAKRRFFWQGSFGMVHKGLDLLLEAFATLPDVELTICGRPEKEPDFFRLYERELRNTRNITLRGWMDLASADFREIMRTHAAIVSPSCSEGGGGAVIHAMHAGLVPICTEEASVDLEDFGIPIPQGSVEAVRTAVLHLAGMPTKDVESRSRAAWEHVRRTHTRANFEQEYRKFVRRLAPTL